MVSSVCILGNIFFGEKYKLVIIELQLDRQLNTKVQLMGETKLVNAKDRTPYQIEAIKKLFLILKI